MWLCDSPAVVNGNTRCRAGDNPLCYPTSIPEGLYLLSVTASTSKRSPNSKSNSSARLSRFSSLNDPRVWRQIGTALTEHTPALTSTAAVYVVCEMTQASYNLCMSDSK